MPSCRRCGSYTKYHNGLCYSCYNSRNSKKGKIYLLESTRKDGTKKIYTGQTKRSVYERIGEHLRAVKNPKSKTYIGRGIRIRVLGSLFSNNRYKAEKTIKKMSPEVKRSLARKGAREYKKKRSWF